MYNLDQVSRLKELVVHRFPWYEAVLPAMDELKWEQFPLLTETILNRYYYEAESPPGTNVYRTSGTSSGRRKAVAYTKGDEERYVELKSRLFADYLRDSGCRTALSDVGTGHAAATAVDVFRRAGLEVEHIPFDQPLARHIQKLEQTRPHVLYTMPSILERIAVHLDRPSQLGLRRIILVGEIASRQWQCKMADIFGLTKPCILDTYGSIEVGTIACYSHELGRYVLVDGLYGEPVTLSEIGLDGELAAGEAVLALTSSERVAFPTIRYVTYDVVRDFRPVRVNGQWRQSFHSVVKRVGPEVKHGEKISVYDVEEAVYRHMKQASIRLEVRQNALTVRIESMEWSDSLADAIRHEIEHRIPEIGNMIQGGILNRINVCHEEVSRTDREQRVKAKQKKLHHE